ncbi:DUF1266 domain-containing protein [Solicola sp. PLA-1-18]|uniref:DUF1266 domain-containing protein n=1 Tax=Solicola sp. PLA-1-18 TaxID=3380532 RepID=UPI003B7EAC55
MERSSTRTAGRGRQNQVGETEHPVRFRRRYVEAGTAVRDGGRSRFLRRGWIVLACLFVSGLTAKLAVLLDVVPAAHRYDVQLLLWVLAVAVVGAWHVYVDGSGPRRDQDAYLAASDAPVVSERQRDLLALASVTDYEVGGWNDSLEDHPSWAVLDPRLRARWKDGEAGTPWPTMPMARLSKVRDHLDSAYRITGEDSLRLYVLDRLDTDSWSLSFLRAVRDGNDAVVTRIAGLTGTSNVDVLACTHARGDRPPVLLWGEDLRELVDVVRGGFVAGYLDREDAWAMLGQVGQIAATLFDTVDDYWDNVRLGYAARTDSLAAVRGLDQAREALRTSRWPAASRSMPRLTGAPVPDAVRDPHAHLDRASGLAP